MRFLAMAVAVALLLVESVASGPSAAPPPEPVPIPARPVDSPPPPDGAGLAVELVAEGLGPLTDVVELPGTDVMLAAEKSGRVVTVEDTPRTVLDWSPWVRSVGNEQGLLTIEPHPGFAENGLVYLFLTDSDGHSQLLEVEIDRDELTARPQTIRRVLEVPQRHQYHQSGSLEFGPDGMLWVSVGDGGGIGDPHGYAQDPHRLEGTVIRVDPSGDPYSIPADNPYADGEGGRPEVWAYGVRNPWRVSIDPPSGLLYLPDVGQEGSEEVNVLPLADGGGANLGWAVTEGTGCFRERPCDPGDYVLPVYEYLHDGQGCAIVGGGVYRGKAIPHLEGSYLFADYCLGWIRSLSMTDTGVTERDWQDQLGRLGSVTSFGTDNDGEMYVTTLAGEVWKLVPAQPPTGG